MLICLRKESVTRMNGEKITNGGGGPIFVINEIPATPGLDAMESQINSLRKHVHSTPGVRPKPLTIGIPTSQSLPPTQYHPPLAGPVLETGQTSTVTEELLSHLSHSRTKSLSVHVNLKEFSPPLRSPLSNSFSPRQPMSPPLLTPPRSNRLLFRDRFPLRKCNRGRCLLGNPAPADATCIAAFTLGTSPHSSLDLEGCPNRRSRKIAWTSHTQSHNQRHWYVVPFLIPPCLRCPQRPLRPPPPHRHWNHPSTRRGVSQTASGLCTLAAQSGVYLDHNRPPQK